MKKLNDFLNKAPLLLTYPFFVLCAFLLVFLVWSGLGYLLTEPGDPFNDTVVLLKVSGLMALIFGLLATLMLSISRDAQKFWALADDLEAKIKSAETTNVLLALFDNDFQLLRKKSSHHVMHSRVKELYTMMKTSYKFMEERENKIADKEDTVKMIKSRILTEHEKHAKNEGMDWAEIAARKILATLNENGKV
jgi:hypothetical protein